MNLNIDKTKLYLLACSFGPDSMALFDMLRKENVSFVVCHVNYHKRGDVSNFEEKSLKEYCNKLNIKFECLDTSNLEKPSSNVNFQAYARDVRYAFFKKIYLKYGASGLFVAHQLDDLLETYLIQKKRDAYVSFYGLEKESFNYGMKIFRPLLDYSKKELEEYDLKNNVPYSIDSSNLTDLYTRNKIRHSVIEKLSLEEKQKILDEIRQKNISLCSDRKFAKAFIDGRDSISTSEIDKLDIKQFSFVLFELVNKYGIYSISKNKIESLKNLINSSKSNIKVKLSDTIFYCQEYGEIAIYETKRKYSYLLEKPGVYSFNEFDLDFTNAEDRNIKEADYPLIIRNSNKNDKYIIKNYTKSVSRLFLDWKMPWHLRQDWPVIVNKNGEIIYIPRYRKKFIDNHTSKFFIKLK